MYVQSQKVGKKHYEKGIGARKPNSLEKIAKAVLCYLEKIAKAVLCYLEKIVKAVLCYLEKIAKPSYVT